jgi:hypothetical protein
LFGNSLTIDGKKLLLDPSPGYSGSTQIFAGLAPPSYEYSKRIPFLGRRFYEPDFQPAFVKRPKSWINAAQL